MKITFLLPGYPTVPSGGFRVIYNYANGLVERGHSVCVVHPLTLEEKDSLSLLALLRRSWGHLAVTQPCFTRRRLKWQQVDSRVKMVYLRGLPLEQTIPDADAIIATAWETAPYVFEYSSKKGVKFHYVADYERWYAASDAERAQMRSAFNLPLIKLAMSRSSAEICTDRNTQENASHIVPLGIDQTLYRVKELIHKRPANLVGMAYRPAEFKGAADGLQAARRAKAAVPELKLILFGSSSRPKNLLPWMQYIRSPNSEEVVRLYNQVAIFLVSSWAEGWGLPGMEAMACGAALCSTDTGGVREYARHRHTALISPPQEPDLLADNLIQLLKDPVLRCRIAVAGNRAISQFTWNRSTSIFEALLTHYVRNS